MPMAPSRFSGGRLSSFEPSSVNSPRTASIARTREPATTTVLSAAASIPDRDRVDVHPLGPDQAGGAGRMPSLTRLIDVFVIVVAAPAMTPGGRGHDVAAGDAGVRAERAHRVVLNADRRQVGQDHAARAGRRDHPVHRRPAAATR